MMNESADASDDFVPVLLSIAGACVSAMGLISGLTQNWGWSVFIYGPTQQPGHPPVDVVTISLRVRDTIGVVPRG